MFFRQGTLGTDHSRETRLPHTTICQNPQNLLRSAPLRCLTRHPHHRQINPSKWEKFTDLSPVPARSSLRPLKLSLRRSPRPPRAVLSSVTSTPDDSSTSSSPAASER